MRAKFLVVAQPAVDPARLQLFCDAIEARPDFVQRLEAANFVAAVAAEIEHHALGLVQFFGVIGEQFAAVALVAAGLNGFALEQRMLPMLHLAMRIFHALQRRALAFVARRAAEFFSGMNGEQRIQRGMGAEVFRTELLEAFARRRRMAAFAAIDVVEKRVEVAFDKIPHHHLLDLDGPVFDARDQLAQIVDLGAHRLHFSFSVGYRLAHFGQALDRGGFLRLGLVPLHFPFRGFGIQRVHLLAALFILAALFALVILGLFEKIVFGIGLAFGESVLLARLVRFEIGLRGVLLGLAIFCALQLCVRLCQPPLELFVGLGIFSFEFFLCGSQLRPQRVDFEAVEIALLFLPGRAQPDHVKHRPKGRHCQQRAEEKINVAIIALFDRSFRSFWHFGLLEL